MKIKIGWRDHNDAYAWFPQDDNFQFCGQITDNLKFLFKKAVAQVLCQQLSDQKNIAVIKWLRITNIYKWMENWRKKQSIRVFHCNVIEIKKIQILISKSFDTFEKQVFYRFYLCV